MIMLMVMSGIFIMLADQVDPIVIAVGRAGKGVNVEIGRLCISQVYTRMVVKLY